MQTPAPPSLPTPASASLSTLITTIGIALVVAGALAITVVLPAEYAIDPLGTGRWLGLVRDRAPAAAPVQLIRAAAGAAPVQSGPLGTYSAAFKYDVFEITLQPYEFVEYKYQMEKGAHLLFSWTATAALLHDFHAEHAGAAPDAAPLEESFDKTERREANAGFIAPFSGIHGWFWENPGANPVTIRLTSAGFYTSAVEIRSDRSRQTRPVRTAGDLR
jgi:hypothetical protein